MRTSDHFDDSPAFRRGRVKSFAVILAAGEGKRFSGLTSHSPPKQHQLLDREPLWVKATRPFQLLSFIDNILVVCRKEDIPFVSEKARYEKLTKVVGVVSGGERRQDSVWEGLAWISRTCPNCSHVFIHDGVRPFFSERLIVRLWEKNSQSAVIPVIDIYDTLKEVSRGVVNRTLDRTLLKRAQTPQLFSFPLLLKAYQMFGERDFTDDAALIETLGQPVYVVEGESENIKITLPGDLPNGRPLIESVAKPYLDPYDSGGDRSEQSKMAVGMGYDVHAFTAGRCIVLGGIEIPYTQSLKGHSDADVLVHAMCDALLGGVGLGDMGTHFSDHDPSYKDISSLLLLEKVMNMVRERDYILDHIDSTVMAEAPKLAPYILEMRIRLGRYLGLAPGAVSIKATTSEGIGFIGRREGIAAMSIVTLRKLR